MALAYYYQRGFLPSGCRDAELGSHQAALIVRCSWSWVELGDLSREGDSDPKQWVKIFHWHVNLVAESRFGLCLKSYWCLVGN